VAEVVLAGLIVGTASELLQRAFPGRDPAIHDVLINGLGALFGALVCRSSAPLSRL
jgi:VanZ family protein